VGQFSFSKTSNLANINVVGHVHHETMEDEEVTINGKSKIIYVAILIGIVIILFVLCCIVGS